MTGGEVVGFYAIGGPNPFGDVVIPDAVVLCRLIVCQVCWTTMHDHGEWRPQWDKTVPDGWELCTGEDMTVTGSGVVQCNLCGDCNAAGYPAYGLKGVVLS